MASRVRTQPKVADIVALARALERHEQRATREPTAAEQEVARQFRGTDPDPAAFALAWLEAVENESADIRSLHQRAESAVHLTSFLVAATAALLGWAATLGAFYFDGSGRVNVVSVLALLVALPGLFLGPFLIAALPGSIAQGIPGFTALAALARATSSSRLVPLLARLLPQDLRTSLALVSGRMASHQRLYAILQKWAMLRWSQQFAVSFQLTAVVATIVLVVFTDLAFGWSTTLTTGSAATDAQRVHRVTSALATPWQWAWPDAAPSLALIEESRYFRVASAPVSREDAARLGNWWPFVVMTIVVYGLLPRVITLTFASARLRAAARATVTAAPGLSALMRRMHRAEIETRAPAPELANPRGAPLDEGHRAAPARSHGVRAVVKWAGVPASDERIATLFPGAAVFAAGGAAAVQDDVALAKRLGSTARGDVLILVKAWEPPLMEFIDFVNTLRQASSAERGMCFVLPVGLDHDVALGPAQPAHVKVWRDKLATVGDPWLRLAAGTEEVTS